MFTSMKNLTSLRYVVLFDAIGIGTRDAHVGIGTRDAHVFMHF